MLRWSGRLSLALVLGALLTPGGAHAAQPRYIVVLKPGAKTPGGVAVERSFTHVFRGFTARLDSVQALFPFRSLRNR